jgi:hypothetical protein
MTRSEFIKALKRQTSDAALFGTISNLERAPGREPRERDVALSAWYRNLDDSNRERVKQACHEAAELAIFSFLCILDGVSAIEDGPEKGELRLNFVREGRQIPLNDLSEGLMHDSFNTLCREVTPLFPECSQARMHEVDSVELLRRSQTSRDGMDLHAVAPDNRIAASDAPAIALPKNEHRKL